MHNTRPRTMLLAALAVGCGGSPPLRDQHLSGATLTFTAAGARPAADVDVRQYGVVVFRNGLDCGLQIVVDRDHAPSARCDTTLGFAADGTRSVAELAQPGQIVALCFHDTGSFAYVARGGDRQWRGSIRVGGGR